MKIIELPCDIMDAPKDIEFSFIVIHSMSVSDIRYFSIIFQSMVLIVAKIEHPSIVEPGCFALSTKNIDA